VTKRNYRDELYNVVAGATSYSTASNRSIVGIVQCRIFIDGIMNAVWSPFSRAITTFTSTLVDFALLDVV
jgi:hypothetical protein